MFSTKATFNVRIDDKESQPCQIRAASYPEAAEKFVSTTLKVTPVVVIVELPITGGCRKFTVDTSLRFIASEVV